MSAFASALAFLGCFAGGVYLVMHDHATLGGWICILCLLGTWGYEHKKGDK